METLIVLDTDVLIDHFRGLPEATAYIKSIPASRRATTDISIMELYKGASDQQELSSIERFLQQNRFVFLSASESASRRAVQILKEYVLSHSLGIPDALIAAIVLETRSRLITGNTRDFEVIDGLRADRPPYRL